MALITCPECGKQISDRSAQCIHCGCPITSPENAFMASQQDAYSYGQDAPDDADGSAKPFAFFTRNPLLTGSVIVIAIMLVIGCRLLFSEKEGTTSPSSSYGTTQASFNRALVGEYEAIYVDNDGSVMDEDDLKLLRTYGKEINLTVRSDRTAVLYMSTGSRLDFVVEGDYFVYGGDDKCPYSYVDGKLTLEVPTVNMKTVFKKA